MDKPTERILAKLALTNKKMNFADMWRCARCSCTKALEIRNSLLKKGLIRSARVRLGQSRWHMITDEGRKFYFTEVVSLPLQTLASLKDLASEVAFYPSRIEDIRELRRVEDKLESEKLKLESLKPHPRSERITVHDPDGNPRELEGYVAEYIERFKKRVENDDVRKSLEALCSIYLQVFHKPSLESKGEVAFRFIRKDRQLDLKEVQLY